MRLAVWRCFLRRFLSSASHESMVSLKGSSFDARAFLAGSFGDRSSMSRYFLTVGSETPSSLAISATLSPAAQRSLIDKMVDMPIISFLASLLDYRSSE